MRTRWQRWIAAFLTVVMLTGLLPMTAYAALSETMGNSAGENAAILAELETMTGSREGAQALYARLKALGVLDGNQWVTEDLTINGEKYSLEEAVAFVDTLADEELVQVGQTNITAGDLKTMLAIEKEIARIRALYSTEEWTDAQLASITSLRTALANGDFLVDMAPAVGPSGVNHNARVNISGPEVNGNSATFTATLTGAEEKQTVELQWQASSGTQTVSGTTSGTVTLSATNQTATFSFTLDKMAVEGDFPVRSTADLVYYVNLRTSNALLSNGKTTMDLRCTTDGTLEEMPGEFTVTGTGNPPGRYGKSEFEHSFDDVQNQAIQWGAVDTLALSQETWDVKERSTDLVVARDTQGNPLTMTIGEIMDGITYNLVYLYDVYLYAKPAGRIYDQYDYGYDFQGAQPEGGHVAQGNEPLLNYIKYRNTPQPVISIDNPDEWNSISLGAWRSSISMVRIETQPAPYRVHYASNDNFGPATEVTGSFTNEKPPAVEGVSVPKGTFYSGQVVPVAITFSEPVKSATATINGKSVPVELDSGEGSNVLVFPYTVQEVDNAQISVTSVTDATDMYDHTMSKAERSDVFEDAHLVTPLPERAVSQLSVTPARLKPTDTVATVTANVEDSNHQLLFNSGTYTLYASIDGGETKVPMSATDTAPGTFTCQLNLEKNTSDVDKNYQVELFIQSKDEPEAKLYVGHMAEVTQTAPVFLTKENISIQTTNFPTEAGPIYADHETLSVAIQCNNAGATWADVTNSDHFQWGVEIQKGTDEIGDPIWTTEGAAEVASVSIKDNDPSAGTIALGGKEGTFRVTLTAKNGGVENKAVTVYTAPVTVGIGVNPILRIAPALQSLAIKGGDPVTVYWTSNLTQKNDEVKEGATTPFTIKVYEHTGHNYMPGDTPPDFTTEGWTLKETKELNSTEKKTISSCVLSGLTEYSKSGGYSYGVEVSAQFNGETYTAYTLVSVSAKPAVVELTKPALYYKEPGGNAKLAWTLKNFDQNSGTFELVVTNNDTGKKTTVGKDTLTKDDGAGQYTGAYTLNFDAIQNGNWRETYTVELRAKNADGSTWSYDSAVLYYYKDEAFQIYVNGERAGASLTMSNEKAPVDGTSKTIPQMDRDEILDLNRNISLADKIGVNPNVPWGNVSDQVVWENSDPNAATINYRQGTLYEDIRLFDYESYNPGTEFILSGLQNGKTTITAKHKTAGDILTDQLGVQVETLKDKLYLFQIAPAAEQNNTTVLEYYVNGSTEKKTVYANGKGLAAIYAPTGISSDVFCRSVVNSGPLEGEKTYVGTFYHENLVSGEQDSTKLMLYPQNTLKLREAANAQLYLKDEDGEPYANKNLTIHAGVYKNGVYCPKAEFSPTANTSLVPGSGQGFTATTDKDGKLTIYMDVDQFYTAAETSSEDRALLASDQLTFMFEVEMTGDGTKYYPQLLELNGMASQSDTVRFGGSLISLRLNDSPGTKHPYAVMQTANMNNGYRRSIIGYTGKVGPSKKNSVMNLETTVLWWGQEAQQDWDLAYYDGVGAKAPNQTVTNQTYEFTDTMVTRSTVRVDEKAVRGWMPSLSSRSLELRYYDGKDNVVRVEPQTFRAVNMMDADDPDKDENAKKAINTLMKSMLSSLVSRGDGDIGVGDTLLGAGFALVGNTGMDFDQLKLNLYGTEDPTVFRGLFLLGFGNANAAITMEEGFGTEKMDIAKNIFSGKARAKTKKEVMAAAAAMKNGGGTKLGLRSTGKEFGGYVESEIYFEDGAWHIHVLNGGFNAGMGMEYMWRVNSQMGPIPVTAEFALGGSVAVSLDVGVDRVQDLNYYLTNLRIGAYFRAFGGLGFDYSIIALKIGLFGNLDLFYNARFFNVSDPGKSKYNNMIGHSLDIGGQVGIEFYAKFIFVSYRKILASGKFTLASTYDDWGEINEAWKQVGKGFSADSGVLASREVYYDARTGQTLYASPTVAAMESRDYLDEYDRRWNPLRISFFALDDEAALDTSLTNAYPGMDPVVTEDGQLMVYLDDMNSTDVTKTRAAFSTWESNKFNAGTPIDDENTGYGDSQVAASGTREFAVAAWTRLNADPKVESGETMTATQQAEMMNATDIVASVYNNGKWETEALTADTVPDLAPAVATANGKAIVAWRSVAASDVEKNLTRFDAEDSILYKTYNGTEWSATKTLYNGTSGAVKGLEAAMLADGTAALVYTIDTNDRPIAADGTQTAALAGQSAQDNTGLEVVYAVVDDLKTPATRDADQEKAAANIRLTYDDQLDENPQITTTEIDGQEHFIIGWNRTEQIKKDGSTGGQDVALRAVDGAGKLRSDLPDSVAEMARGDGVKITSNFRFSKGAETLNNLSITWAEPINSSAETADGQTADAGVPAEKDRLMAVKFVASGNDYGITVPVEMAAMADYTTIDHFDAYLQGDGPDLRAVILGTTYGDEYVEVTDEDGNIVKVYPDGDETKDPVSVKVAKSTANLYTASGEYTNAVSIDKAEYEAEGVVPGFTLPVQLTVTNRGIDTINQLTVKMGNGTVKTVTGIALAPGDNLTFTVDYLVPSNIQDVTCAVTADFGSGRTDDDTTTLALSTPDVGVSRMDLVKQEGGNRHIQVALYNDGEVPLDSAKHVVKVALYSDAACENQIVDPKEVTGDDLPMVNDGGYTTQLIFDIKNHLGEDKEIPDGGMQVYAKAWIESKPSTASRVASLFTGDDGETTVLDDTRMGNDVRTLTLTSLLEQQGGAPATVTSALDNSGDGSKVTVTVQNNSLTQTTSGNLIVTLLDADGNVLEQKQSYQSNEDEFITLEPEASVSQEFTFSAKGHRVEVTYSNAVLTDDTNANLDAVKLEGVELTYNADTKTYSGKSALADALLTVIPQDPRATVTVNGEAYDKATRISLRGGASVTIEVTAADKTTKQTYKLTTTDTTPGGGGGGGDVSYGVTVPKDVEHGKVTVSPEKATAGKTVTITAKPDQGYQVGTVTVTKEKGGTVTVTNKGEGVYTFPMPGDKVTVTVTFVPEGTWTNPFADVAEKAWYFDAVKYVNENGLMSGTGATTFEPELTTTRGMIVTILHRLEGEPGADGANAFTDVKDSAWYAKAVAWANANGIVTGYGEGKFGPDDVITREQMAAILYRYAQFKEYDTEAGADLSKYTDAGEISGWALDALRWANAAGLVTGTSDTTLSPGGSATRAQVATILMRFCETVANQTEDPKDGE